MSISVAALEALHPDKREEYRWLCLKAENGLRSRAEVEAWERRNGLRPNEEKKRRRAR